ncbi:hypothetical protein MML48_6g00021104 [Holotrichia oblita]|uniref:Uncharacterized protein n=1 Tax=Holotrichia oblita TaxID=644536 RepID=A0ACB9SYT5_HOLOL|nr:hypothetical protein MML48_6g00021104 [Holotrichia oblita]
MRYLVTGSTNLVGKFTQSVRRIVQDVKDEGSASGQTKEEVIETNERLRAVRLRLDESYDTAKKALVSLMTKYNDSKSVHNVFQRYNLLKTMIKEVIRLETQYWTLVDIPKQEKQGDGSRVRPTSLRHYGEDAKVRGRSQNVGEIGRRSSRQTQEDRTLRK